MHFRKSGVRYLAICLVFLAVTLDAIAIKVREQRKAASPPPERVVVLLGAGHETGFAYVTRHGRPELNTHGEPSAAILFENDVALGPANAIHADIRQFGKGRYSVWHDTLYFSASDNSDPNTNGRRYRIVYKTTLKAIDRTLARAVYLGAASASAAVILFFGWVGFAGFGGLAALKTLFFDTIRRDWRRPLAWSSLTALAILLFLHPYGALPFGWERRIMTNVVPAGGTAYSANLGTEWMSQENGATPAAVLENGVELFPVDPVPGDIQARGGGRHCFLKDAVIFSASDNSDPRSNGRIYEVSWPYPIPHFLIWTVFLAACALSFYAAVRWGWLQIVLKAKVPLAVSMGIVVIPFLISHLPFFLYHPIPEYTADTESYFGPLREWENGQWPTFTIRTPGYPLFMKAVFFFSDNIISLLLVQSIASLAAGLCVVYAVYKRSSRLALLAGFAMAVFLSSDHALQYDTSVMSESLFSNCLIAFVAFLILAMAEERILPFVLCSLSIAGVILVRPAGMFMIVVYGMVGAFLWWNNFGWRRLLSFGIPFPLVMLLLCTYNQLTIGAFTISPYGEVAFAETTSIYWEQSQKYPPAVNAKIALVTARVDPKDREFIFTSWNFDLLYGVFARSFQQPEYTLDETKGYLENRALLKDVSLNAIWSHKIIYFKYVLTQLKMHFFTLIRHDVPYYSSQLPSKYRDTYCRGPDSYYPTDILKECAIPQSANIGLRRISNAEVVVFVKEFPLSRLHKLMASAMSFAFRNFIWTYVFFAVFILSAIKLFKSRFRHRGAFVLFAICSVAIGYSLVICCIVQTHDRYSYPIEFQYYLPAALLPLIFMTERQTSSTGAKS